LNKFVVFDHRLTVRACTPCHGHEFHDDLMRHDEASLDDPPLKKLNRKITLRG